MKNHLSGLINDLEDLPGVTLDVASRLYVPEDKRLYKNYTKAAKRIFKTSIEKVNFNEPDTVAESINNWVSVIPYERLKYAQSANIMNSKRFLVCWFTTKIIIKLNISQSNRSVNFWYSN